jgi:uridine phosphorylase
MRLITGTIMNNNMIHPPLFQSEGKSIFAGINETNVSRYVIFTVRDPLINKDTDLAEDVAKLYLQDATLVADTQMFITYTGKYKGVPITIVSQGSGAPETEIIFGEFLRFTKADTFIRLGCSGTYLEKVRVGDFVIADAAVREEGTSNAYIKPGYPAVANYEVNMALTQAAENLGFGYHVGITLSTDSIYAGQGRPLLDYFQEESKGIPEYYTNANVLNFERETSLILTLCNIFNKRGGSVNAVVNNMVTGEMKPGAGYHETAQTILEGIAILSTYDKQKEKNGKRYWTPSLIENK